MKITRYLFVLMMLIAVSACTINPLIPPTSGNTNSVLEGDLLAIANEVLKGSLQMTDIGTNALAENDGIHIPEGKLTTFDFYFSCNTNYYLNAAILGGEGSLTADCAFGKQINIAFDGGTNFEVLTISGVILFSGFKLGSMVSPVNGILSNVLVITNLVSSGTITSYYTFQGDLNNGGTNIHLAGEAEGERAYSSSVVTVFRNCFVNGLNWVPELN